MRAFSSAGLEHLPYKQRVGGSNPSTPTKTKLGCEKSHPFFLSAQLLIRMKKVKNSEVLLSYIREGRTMTQREKLWLIISLSIPSILAQISATVMFFIDASMVGHLGAKASASIGLVESTGWLMGGLAAAANMGFSVQVAHFIGANDFEAARRVLRQSMVCCMIWAVFISITSLIISPYLPYWLGGTPEIARDASLYFAIFGLAGIFFQIEGLCGSMLKCSGNMKIPSMLNIGMCVMDVVFNYFFIYILDLGVVGAAMGTGAAMLVTACLMFYFLMYRSKILSLVGRPGSLAITVESLCYMPGYGIAEAATTLVGQGIGAGQKMLTQSFARMSVGLGIGVMTLMGVLMWIFAPQLMSIMSPVEDVIALGTQVLRIEAWAEPMFAAAIVCNGVFIGAGDTIVPAIMSLASMWAVRLSLAATMAPKFGLRGVWTAMAIELTFRGSIFLVRLFKGNWTNKLKVVGK